MTLATDIGQARQDPAALERLYRQALADGEAEAFAQALRGLFAQAPADPLLAAWAHRLDLVGGAGGAPALTSPQLTRHWRAAIAWSAVLGALFALGAGGQPPLPIPGKVSPWFWVGWGPLLAAGILSYLAAMDRSKARLRWCAGAAAAVACLAVAAAFTAWHRTDQIAVLVALHLPFVAWIAVGGGAALGHPHPDRQFHAYVVKSAETALTAVIYLTAGGLLVALTVGIFAALDIVLPQTGLRAVAAWGIGAVPILALASVCDPAVAPAQQPWATGLARILRILTRLLLPLALGVLAVYELWFIPLHFWRPFEEREVLIVYNATLMAILALLAVAVTAGDEGRSRAQDAVLRYALLAVGVLALLLNVYALAAIAARTLQLGLTPNRYAVLGWNAATSLMLAGIAFPLWRARPGEWVVGAREAVGRVMVLAAAWAAWVLLILPLSFP